MGEIKPHSSRPVRRAGIWLSKAAPAVTENSPDLIKKLDLTAEPGPKDARLGCLLPGKTRAQAHLNISQSK